MNTHVTISLRWKTNFLYVRLNPQQRRRSVSPLNYILAAWLKLVSIGISTVASVVRTHLIHNRGPIRVESCVWLASAKFNLPIKSRLCEACAASWLVVVPPATHIRHYEDADWLNCNSASLSTHSGSTWRSEWMEIQIHIKDQAEIKLDECFFHKSHETHDYIRKQFIINRSTIAKAQAPNDMTVWFHLLTSRLL